MTLLRTIAALGLGLSPSFLGLELAAAANTASPNKAIAKPKCDSSKSVSVRYSSGSERLYLEASSRGACITVKEVWERLRGKAPLYAVDSSSGDVSKTATGTWLLTESLYIEDGVTLQVSAVCARHHCASYIHVYGVCVYVLLFFEVCVIRFGTQAILLAPRQESGVAFLFFSLSGHRARGKACPVCMHTAAREQHDTISCTCQCISHTCCTLHG